MNAYASVIAARFRTLLQYRGAALGGIATQCFFGLVRLMILEAFYRSAADGTAGQPMSFAEAVGYIWLGQATLAMQPWNVDADVRAMIRSGTVAYELVRPLDLHTLWYCRALAWRTAPVLLRLAPLFVLAMLVLPQIGLHEWALRAPPSVAAACAWGIAMIGAVLLSCAVTTVMNISLLWTISGDGIVMLAASLVILLSGMVIPLPLFPDWAQPILISLPFAGIVDLPSRLYTGNLPPASTWWVVALQLGWTIAFIALGRSLLAKAAKRIVVQGG